MRPGAQVDAFTSGAGAASLPPMSIASTLRGLASGAVGLAAPLALAACLEAQPAPELPSTPASAFTLTTLADGLDKPWAVAPLPDGGALVTEKPGRIWRVAADGTKSEVSGGPSPYYVDDPQSQAGLFDVVAAPDFAESGRVYVSSAVGTADANGTALFSYRLDGTALTDERELFRSRDPKDTNAHFGAKIAVLPDGTLALSTGDGFAYREAAQDLGSHLGKIVRVNADGSVPADNPYADSVRPQLQISGRAAATSSTVSRRARTMDGPSPPRAATTTARASRPSTGRRSSRPSSTNGRRPSRRAVWPSIAATCSRTGTATCWSARWRANPCAASTWMTVRWSAKRYCSAT